MLQRIAVSLLAGLLISCVIGMIVLVGLVAWSMGPVAFWLFVGIFVTASATVFLSGKKS